MMLPSPTAALNMLGCPATGVHARVLLSPYMIGFAPEPYAPRVIGFAAVPLALILICPSHASPRFNKILSPAANGVLEKDLTNILSKLFHGALRPSLESLPPLEEM